MSMRTFIGVKSAGGGSSVSSHARYMSERERNPNREEPESRPLFTHDQDGLKHKAADRYLAGGEGPKTRSDALLHLIISFNSYDRKELEKLERTTAKSTKFVLQTKKDAPDKSTNSELRDVLDGQVQRDLPYVRAVRQMLKNIEERTAHTELRYALSVHRHTAQTHVHLILRREHKDKETGEKVYFEKKGLPAAFVNGRDENGRARGGLLDRALSDSLDTMIPRRNRRKPDQGERAVELNRVASLAPESKVQNLNIESERPKAPERNVQNLYFRQKDGHQQQQHQQSPPEPEKVQNVEAASLRPGAEAGRDFISYTSELKLPPRYSAIRREPGAVRSEPLNSSTGERNAALSRTQQFNGTHLPENQSKVQNLNFNVHDKGQNLNFGASPNPAESSIAGQAENIFTGAATPSIRPPSRRHLQDPLMSQ